MPLTLGQRPRTLCAEILDALPADHPDAVSSRRDLRLFNAAMGNWRWMQAVMPSLVRPGERVLEIGAGGGELGAPMVQKGLAWDGLDRAPRPANWPASSAWLQADIFEFDGWERYPVVAGNFVFHHFSETQLRQLGAKLNRHTRLLVVGDLRRGRLQQCLFWAVACSIRANRVSRHDGWVSIAAGFRRRELPTQLGLDPRIWRCRVVFSQISAYRFIAERRP